MSTAGDDSPSADGNAANASNLSAPKNRQCPFCHESFTSSSLGRHLDLYVKEKNPKAPDGIHDVDKIRQIRGAITRRQPRRSTKAFEDGTSNANDSRTGTPHNNVLSPYGLSGSDRPAKWSVNKPTWEATGVMTDIPTTPTLALDNNMRKHLQRSDIALRKRMAEDRTRLRATELALQELLDSVNAAKSQAYPSKPYTFDFLAQSFPGLCLRLLQTQPGLQSIQVIENPKFCPIGPPNHAHYELLMQLLRTRLEEFAATQSQVRERTFSLQSATNSVQSPTIDEHDTSVYITHLTQAWEVWKSTPESQKAKQWHIEVFRALSSAQDDQKKLTEALGKAKAESEHLRVQIERLNECQQPKEFTYQIPTNWHISAQTASALVSCQTDAPPDRETLINKWTSVVRGNSKFQKALPEFDLVDVSTASDGMYLDGMNGAQKDEQDEDGDSADATGEEDEDISGSKTNFTSRAQGIDTNFMDRNMLDPGLREDGDMEVDEGDYGAEMLLSARAQRGKGYEM